MAIRVSGYAVVPASLTMTLALRLNTPKRRITRNGTLRTTPATSTRVWSSSWASLSLVEYESAARGIATAVFDPIAASAANAAAPGGALQPPS